MTQTEMRPGTSITTTAGTPSHGNAAARTLAVVAFVCAGLAVFLLPPVFGVAGIICASISMAKGDSLGKWALAVSIAGLVLGMILAYVVMQSQS